MSCPGAAIHTTHLPTVEERAEYGRALVARLVAGEAVKGRDGASYSVVSVGHMAFRAFRRGADGSAYEATSHISRDGTYLTATEAAWALARLEGRLAPEGV